MTAVITRPPAASTGVSDTPDRHQLAPATEPLPLAGGGRSGAILAAFCAIFAAAAGSWFVVLRDVPAKTPLVFFADSYSAPLVAPGWIEEDADRFAALDGKTIALARAGFGNGLDAQPLDGLVSALEQISPHVRRSGCLIVDVRSVGGVLDSGQPALLPPSCDPLDAATWLPLDRFCERIADQCGPATRVTLVLDCLPCRTRWSAGMAYNTFPEAVATWVERESIRTSYPRWSVVCRTEAESRWRSAAMTGSAVQRQLRDAILGEADTQPRDGTVSGHELMAYLDRCDPAAVYGSVDDSEAVAFAIPARSRSKFRPIRTDDAETPSSRDRLRTAWTRTANLLDGRQWQRNLPAVSKLLSVLVAWEDAERIGADGRSGSVVIEREVSRWLESLEASTETAILPAAFYPSADLHRFAGLDAVGQSSIDASGGELLAATSRDQLQAAVDRSRHDERAAASSLHAMAAFLAADASDRTWSDPNLVRRLLQQRHEFDQLAVPDDVRASSLLWGDLEALQASNLAAFDAVVIGTGPALAQVPRLLDEGDRLQAGLASRSDRIQSLLTTCDRARLELPFLAEWASIRDATATDHGDHDVNRLVLPLVVALDELDASLLSQDHVDVDALPDGVTRQFAMLRQQFDAEWAQLAKRPALTAEELTRLERLLAVPLLPSGDAIEAAVAQRLAMLSRLRSQRSSLASHRTASDDMPRRMLSNWSGHPALVMLEDPARRTRPATAGVTVEGWNRDLRSAIRSIERDAAAVAGQSAEGLVAALVRHRRGIGLVSSSGGDEAMRVRRLAWADLLLWLGHAMLNDCWGPLEQDAQPAAVRQADAVLHVASSLTFDREKAINALRDRIGRTASAMQSALSLDAESLTPAYEGEPLATQTTVSRHASAVDLPNGQAWLGVRALGQRLGTRSQALAMQGDATRTIALPIDGSQLVTRAADEPLMAEAWFRGNRYRSRFDVVPLGGRETTMQVEAGPTTVMVRSERRQTSAVTFILDCSASMNDPVIREGQGGQTTKLNAAATALRGLLGQLSARPGSRVGVMLYGHRASHDPAGRGVLRQSRYLSKFPVDGLLSPYADVETILPPGRFGPAELGTVDRHLKAIVPWGETPLYRAVAEAADGLANLPPNITRNVVVITDGRDYQFDPPASQRVGLTDALTRSRAAHVAVHVVGFGMSARQQADAADEFDGLATRTGGTVGWDVGNASELLEHLRSLLGPSEYTWASGDGRGGQSPVNEPVTIAGPFPRAVTIGFGAKKTTVTLGGRERLVLGADDRRVRSAASAVTDLMTDDASIAVGLDRPKREGNDIRFTMRWARIDGRFLRRPVAYRITVQPTGRGGESVGASYSFADSRYDAGTSVPQITLTAHDWPTDATNARVSIALQTQPMVDSVVVAATDGALIRRELDDGVRCDIRATRAATQCIIRRDARSTQGKRFLVQLVGDEMPQRRSQRIDDRAGLAIDTFTHAAITGHDGPRTVRITRLPTGRAATTIDLPIGGNEGVLTPATAPATRTASAREPEGQPAQAASSRLPQLPAPPR